MNTKEFSANESYFFSAWSYRWLIKLYRVEWAVFTVIAGKVLQAFPVLTKNMCFFKNKSIIVHIANRKLHLSKI